jgi:hypothetical protein
MSEEISMLKMKTSANTRSSFRSAGWAAIASGTIGIMGAGFLIAYLVVRSDSMNDALRMGKIHDAVVILQFLLLIPVAFALYKLSQQRSPGMSNATPVTGIAALSFTALFLLLGLVKAMAVVLQVYFPGALGGSE